MHPRSGWLGASTNPPYGLFGCTNAATCVERPDWCLDPWQLPRLSLSSQWHGEKQMKRDLNSGMARSCDKHGCLSVLGKGKRLTAHRSSFRVSAAVPFRIWHVAIDKEYAFGCGARVPRRRPTRFGQAGAELLDRQCVHIQDLTRASKALHTRRRRSRVQGRFLCHPE